MALVDFSNVSVRGGRAAPITCVACGCRLERRPGADGWWHFRGPAGHDARGCRVACADRLHYGSGTALLAS